MITKFYLDSAAGHIWLVSFVDIFYHNSQLRQKYDHCDAQELIALENGEKFKHSRKRRSPIILFTFLLSRDF